MIDYFSRVDENVVSLDVPVDDVVEVQILESRQDLSSVVGDEVDVVVERAEHLAQQFGQRTAGDPLHEDLQISLADFGTQIPELFVKNKLQYFLIAEKRGGVKVFISCDPAPLYRIIYAPQSPVKSVPTY